MFTNHLTEDHLEFHLPDWASASIVAALMVTLLAAIYIIFGTVLAIAYLITFAMSMIFWMKTTFRTKKMRRIIPYVVLTLVLLLIQNVELWFFDFPTRWHQVALAIGDPAFGTKIFMGFYFFGIIGLGLLSILLTFFHNHFGNFIIWFLFIHGIVFPLACIGAFLTSQPTAYVPGIATGIPLAIVCGSGIRFILKNHGG